MTNIASLVPITRGDPRGGRKPGQTNLVTRALKHALILAAELSDHSKDKSLVSYCVWLANERPDLYVSMLGRLVPVQAKVKHEGVHPSDLRLTTDMPLETLISNFEAKLKSDYQPMLRAFEHDSDDDED